MQHLWTLLAYRPIYTRQVESQAENPVLEGYRDYTAIIPRLYVPRWGPRMLAVIPRFIPRTTRDYTAIYSDVLPRIVREATANKENAPRLYRDYTAIYRDYTAVIPRFIPRLYRDYTAIIPRYTANIPRKKSAQNQIFSIVLKLDITSISILRIE